jgi:ubiquinone/menaquinone biosynthesis C-methylase UbiE
MGSEQIGKEAVRRFWNIAASGERYGDHQDRIRYELEPEITPFADFASGSGRRLLEIGVGMGSDFIRFLRAGTLATGIDLTDRAVAITKQRLAAANLTADVRVADAEQLPFQDDSFDDVYSWGVLHHTPDTQRAIQEALRVLAPGGQLKLMLYHRHSWVAIAAWIRFCLMRGRPFADLAAAVAHIESPGTQAFVPSEVRAMLRDVEDVSVVPVLTSWDRKFAPGISSLFGNRLGWFLLIRARKKPT